MGCIRYILLAAALCTGTAQAADCLDGARVKNELQVDFEFLGPEGPAKLDLCDEQSTSRHALETLLFLKDLPPLDLEKSEFNPGLLGSNPYKFFKDRVKRIVLDERKESEECSDQRLAYVSSSWREEKKIWICPNSRNFGLITFSSALVHESRHLDGMEFNHVQCDAGLYERQFSCDNAYADGGSYGVGLEYLVRLSRSPKVLPEIRASARRGAATDFLQRFNLAPLDIKRGALLRDVDSLELQFFDGDQVVGTGIKTKPDTVLSVQGGLPLFFEPSSGEVKLYSFQRDLIEPVSDVLTTQFHSLPHEQQKNLLDVAYTENSACLLFKTEIQCFGTDRQLVIKNLSGIKPIRFQTSAKSRLIPSGVLSFWSEDGFLRRLPSSAEDLKKIVDWEKIKGTPKDLYQPWWGGEITLSHAGKVETFDARKSIWTPVGLERKFRDLVAPFYWSKKLKEL